MMAIEFDYLWSEIQNYIALREIESKTKGQQLKGNSALSLYTFWHFSTLFQSFFQNFPPGIFLRIKGFYYCFSS